MTQAFFQPRSRPAGRALGSRAALLACALLTGPALPRLVRAQSDVLIPNQMHKSLTFELHSVEDEVSLYAGDPQNLMRLELRPVSSLTPNVEFSNTNQVATLRVRDLSLFEKSPDETADEVDPDLEAADAKTRLPVSQGWTIQLMPAAPADFVLQCDGGKGTFDFTDLPVRTVHLLADTSQVQVDFKRPNLVVLERFKLTVRSGTAELHGLLNARPKTMTLQLDASKCEIDLTGKPFAGQAELFVEGVPAKLWIRLSEDVAFHLEGPAATLARFDHEGMVRRDLGLESRDFAAQPCRVQLHFSQSVPNLEVHWGE